MEARTDRQRLFRNQRPSSFVVSSQRRCRKGLSQVRIGDVDEQLPVADIPAGFFEYKAMFREPIFSAWYEGKHSLLGDVYRVLQPWGADLDKVSGNVNPRTLKEAQVTFAIPNPSVLVNIGIGGVTMVAQNAQWSQASALTALFQAVMDCVTKTGRTDVLTQETTLGFHLKPGPKPFRDLMNKFVDAKALGKEKASMVGVGFYDEDSSLLIDKSAIVSNGVFVKITRVFPSATRFEEMASIIWKEEEKLLHSLGFRTEP